MSTNKTENLGLHSWVETDPVLMSEFNENFGAIDSMLPRIASGSYVGTNEVGSAYPNELHFDFEPKFIIIHSRWNGSIELRSLTASGNQLFDVQAIKHAIANNTNSLQYAEVYPPCERHTSNVQVYVSLKNGNRTISWYLANEAGRAVDQSNGSSYIYYYTAIG